MNENIVSISRGNSKMGYIPSVSLPPLVTCPAGVPCARKCYAAKLCKIRPTVRAAYNRNLNIYKRDPAAYWLQVRAAAATSAFFRYHVSGDIPDRGYLLEMVKTALQLPKTRFLAYTKRYSWVNDYIDFFGALPSNLIIIFSKWGPSWPVPNPHNLPTFDVIFHGQDPAPGVFVCPGNCTQCAVNGFGCYHARPGTKIAAHEH